MALEHGVMLSKTSPAFLHANSTSHTWCFSAIAEIIDNAYDPDVGATELRIDKVKIKDQECLVFMDNGAGMNPEKLHRMLSFGYCEKVEVRGHKPVGQYGNGFKSGSMRIGKDAVVFTKCKATWSVGFLSQTFLRAIQADTVLVPIITFDRKTNQILSRDDTEGSLKSLFGYSIFTTLASCLKEYRNLHNLETGTRIIIYNLKQGADGKLEMDFNSNPADIINSEHHEFDSSTAHRIVKEYTPEYRRSLREYCSILFLKPRMKIILRGEKVRTKLVSKSLHKREVALYRPRFLDKPLKIIFGYSVSSEDFGVMLYHRNRLIKAYERVGCQKQHNGQGVGVVGVVEVDFLEPIHNKQDFNKTDRYNACMNTLAQKLNDYWQEKTNSADSSQSQAAVLAPWDWVQCDNCLKWRRLPTGIDPHSLPEKWFCYMNQDPTHNRCDIGEEPEDEDKLIEQGTKYEKRVKKQKSAEQMNRNQAINQREESLRQKEAELLRVKNEIEKLNNSPNGGDGRTRAELEKAKQELEQAKHREAEQRKIIEHLQQQKHLLDVQQQRLGKAVMNDVSSVASISNIARNGSQESVPVDEVATPAVTPAAVRKRPSTGAGPKSSKKMCTQTSKNALEISPAPHASAVEDDDDTQDVKPQLVVKFPSKRKNYGDVILIGSDSEAEDEPTARASAQKTADDTDVQILPTGSKNSKRANNDKNVKCKDRLNVSNEVSNDVSRQLSDRRIESSDSKTESKKPAKTFRTVRTQTLFPDDPNNAILQLNNLRCNVAKLLRVILPDMDVFANIALENVDSALVEVLRVNDVTAVEPTNGAANDSAANGGNAKSSQKS